MSARRHRLLAAVLALLLGTSLAAGTAYAAPLTKTKVKAIAAAVVKNKAPTLSVAKANDADDAGKLEGKDGSFYLERFAQSTTENNTAIPAATTTQVLNAAVITVPSGVGYVRVDASVVVAPIGNTGVAAWIQKDSVCVDAGDDFDNRSLGHSANQDTISITRIYPVTPGDHGFRMCVISGSGTQVDNRTLIAQTVGLAG